MNGGIIEGNSNFLVNRRVEQLEKKVKNLGWAVTHVQGSVAGSAEAAVAGNIFIGAKQFLFVWEPAKDIKGLLNVMPFTDDKLAVFLVHLGTTAERNKLKKAFPTIAIETHNEETRPWKKDEFAAEWLQNFVKEDLETKIDLDLAKALVARVGNDLPHLMWEVRKANMLRESGEKITPQQIQKALAPINELQPTILAKALMKRDEKALLKAAQKLKSSVGRDETSLVMWTVRSLTPMVLSWAAVKRLQRGGSPVSLISQRLGISKWKIEKVLIPESQLWKGDDLIPVLKALSDAEQAVFAGAQSPWWVLVSSLVGSVRVVKTPPIR